MSAAKQNPIVKILSLISLGLVSLAFFGAVNGRALAQPVSAALVSPTNHVAVITVPSCDPRDPASANCQRADDSQNLIVDKYINPAIIFLGIGFGLIITIMIVIGGIQYSASAGNPQAVEAAKKRITNALFALLIFAFMFAFLQWIVPGGIEFK